jgi:hypothetical protein
MGAAMAKPLTRATKAAANFMMIELKGVWLREWMSNESED